MIHDVNGYYRELGIAFPFRPTRRELRLAYTARDGQRSARLTAILALLLDPGTRRQYDTQPLGKPYVDSLLLETYLTRIAQRSVHLGMSPKKFVEKIKLSTKFTGEPSATTREAGIVVWPWSYYCHGSASQNIEALAAWQQLLVGCVPYPRFAVGFTESNTCEVFWDRRIPIVLLPDTLNPTKQLALTTVLTQLTKKRVGKMRYAAGQKAVESAKADADTFTRRANKFSFFSKDMKKDKDEVFVRFLDDFDDVDGDGANFWIVVNTHDWVPTKAAPESMPDEKKKSWPESMRAVCRTQNILDGEHDDCFICSFLTKEDKKGKQRKFTKSPTAFMRAVAREKIKITKEMVDADPDLDEKAIGKFAWTDVEIEVEETDSEGNPTGNKVYQPKIYLIDLKRSQLAEQVEGYASEHGTVLDRDYKIIRHGTGLETKYAALYQDRTPGFDLSDPETRAPYDAVASFEDLVEHVDHLHSDDYYRRFFDTRFSNDDDSQAGDEKSGAESNGETKRDGDGSGPTDAQMQAMKDRALGRKKAQVAG